MKLVISTRALIGRRPIAVSLRCSHGGDGPLRTPRTRRSAKAGHSEAEEPKARRTATGHGNRPASGATAGDLSLPREAAARSRAIPLTPVQSPRLGVRLTAISG